MASNTTNDKDTSKNQTNNHDTRDDTDNESPYIPTPELDPSSADPDEEVTPGNVQAPVDDEDKLKQDNVLNAQHVEQGYPANMIPRTDEERERMKKDGLIQ